jgi:hypothetical protein
MWRFCGEDFMKGDPTRFEEPIWGCKSPRHQDEIVGRRIVTAQVTDEEGEWLWIEIKEVEILEYKLRGQPAPLKKRIRRRRRTVEGGRPQRWEWSDEGARMVVARDAGKER